MTFPQVVFFGYSPLFEEMALFNARLGVRSFLITSDRLKRDCSQLELPHVDVVVTDRLDRSIYEKSGIRGKEAIGISIGSPFIFRSDDISFFEGNLVNSHGAPLPEYRGGGGFSWRILNGDKRGASLIHRISLGIDAGEVLFRHIFSFDQSEKIPADFAERQLKEDKATLVPFLKALIRREADINEIVASSVEESSNATYFPRLCTDIHGVIDWSQQIRDIEATIHAFSHPYNGAKTSLRGRQIRIFRCEIAEERYWHPFCRGIIIDSNMERILVACNAGTLKILTRDISFSNEALKIRDGDRLLTSEVELGESTGIKTVYTPLGLRTVDYRLIE